MKGWLIALATLVGCLTVTAMVLRAVAPTQILWAYLVWVDIPFVVWAACAWYSHLRGEPD